MLVDIALIQSVNPPDRCSIVNSSTDSCCGGNDNSSLADHAVANFYRIGKQIVMNNFGNTETISMFWGPEYLFSDHLINGIFFQILIIRMVFHYV